MRERIREILNEIANLADEELRVYHNITSGQRICLCVNEDTWEILFRFRKAHNGPWAYTKLVVNTGDKPFEEKNLKSFSDVIVAHALKEAEKL